MADVTTADKERAAKLLVLGCDCHICKAHIERCAHALAEARAEGRADGVAECVKLATEFDHFTGAGYCDPLSDKFDAARVHDYGRGGEYVRGRIAAVLSALLPAPPVATKEPTNDNR